MPHVQGVAPNESKEEEEMKNKKIKPRQKVEMVLERWQEKGYICNPEEFEAAWALLETGMEERPLHAIERAHVVLAQLGLIAEEDD